MAAVSRTTIEDTKPSLLSPKSKGKGTYTTFDGARVVSTGKNMSFSSQLRYCAAVLMCPALLIDNAKDILCRNVTIYGKCRYEDKGAVTQSMLWDQTSFPPQAVPSIIKPRNQ